MDYSHITTFLDKFKKVLFQKETTNLIIVQVVTKHISVPITTSMVQVKGKTIYIQGSPMLRNEILIHKKGILSDLQNTLPNRPFNEIY